MRYEICQEEQEVGEQATVRQSSGEAQRGKRILCATILGFPTCIRAQMVAENLVKVWPEEDGVKS